MNDRLVMNIYVGNLPWRTTDEDLKNIFEGYGRVDSSSIVKDRETDRSRGFGFVEMPDSAEAQNAIDALENGGKIELRVASDSNGCINLIVKDDGPGVPEDDIQRIFEPFFSTKVQGTGLGMAIVHNLIDQHGGSISVRCNDGAEFTVTLPRRPD